jgi:protein involved in polysaccharide export with SLBB domain
MKRTLLFCCAGLLLATVVGCSSTANRAAAPAQFADLSANSTTRVAANPLNPSATLVVTNQLDPDWLRPGNAPFTLGPGDRLEIEILGTLNSRALTAVGPDGKIYYYLLPGLNVWGLTLAETRDLLQKELGKYLTEPQLTVTLREVASKHVWLLGRLNRPGVYPLAAPMSLLEAIAMAGGTASSAGTQVSLQELADLRHSFVMRQGQFLPVDFSRLLREGDTSQNIYLQPDDFVYVPSASAQQVYVMGAVRSPRSVAYTDGMTLVSAMASATGAATVDWFVPGTYGVMADAYLSHVAIVRGSLSEPQMSVLDYGAIIKGKAPDVLLEPGDIVYVPNAPYATLKRYLNTILGTFITTVAANEGIAAGGGTPLGTSLSVGGK